jgi:uncharacterized protein (DUF849 family)
MTVKKTIITCAVTGAHTLLKHNPNLPITPKQIAESALEAASAGASVVHIHVRDPDTALPSMKFELYKEVFDRIKEKNSRLIINLTTGPGGTGPSSVVFDSTGSTFKTAIERTYHIVQLRPDICTLDFNTMNRGPKLITVNSIPIIREMSKIIRSAGVKPELEIFDSGDLHIAKVLLTEGLIVDPPLWQIATGVKWGWDSSFTTLEYAKNLLPKDAVWYAFGVGKWQMPFVALSSISGGHVRVGLEDNVYIEKNKLAKSNAELVEKAVRIIRDTGNDVASSIEAREILNLR